MLSEFGQPRRTTPLSATHFLQTWPASRRTFLKDFRRFSTLQSGKAAQNPKYKNRNPKQISKFKK
jgi:hypothetical protein